MITGAIIAVVAMVVGFLGGRVTRPGRSIPTNGPNLYCGCKHHLSFHHKDGGGCVTKISNPGYNQYSYSGTSSQKTITCPCLQYTGEKPVEELDYATLVALPPIIDPDKLKVTKRGRSRDSQAAGG